MSSVLHRDEAPVSAEQPQRVVSHHAASFGVGAVIENEPRSPSREWLEARVQGRMPRGAVLFHMGTTTFQAPGGGEVQFLETARALEKRGIAVRPFVPWTDRLEHTRLLHIFGMSREALDLARIARKRGVPVVLSPICWLEPRSLLALAGSRTAGGIALAKWAARALSPVALGWRSRLIELCNVLLPNSLAEANQLIRLFGARPERIHVVPNGVSPVFGESSSARFQAVFGPEPFVLYVGRIEPRKNVLGLVRACRRIDRPLVVIGDAVPGHDDYAATCRREATDTALWLPRVEHDDPFLASSYAAARVFALPSWFETPGLAALEATLAGAPVVITPFGCTREYFGEYARYARPDRPRELAEAIEAAWERGPISGASTHVRSRYLWRNVAQETARAYARVAS